MCLVFISFDMLMFLFVASNIVLHRCTNDYITKESHIKLLVSKADFHKNLVEVWYRIISHKIKKNKKINGINIS